MLYSEIAQPVIGFVGAGVSYVFITLADVVPEVVSRPELSGWMQLGGTAGLIGGLSYGCVTLWKALQTQRSEMNQERKDSAKVMADERAAMNLSMANERTAHEADKARLNADIRGELKKQTQDLIEVLNKLDPDKP